MGWCYYYAHGSDEDKSHRENNNLPNVAQRKWQSWDSDPGRLVQSPCYVPQCYRDRLRILYCKLLDSLTSAHTLALVHDLVNKFIQ